MQLNVRVEGEVAIYTRSDDAIQAQKELDELLTAWRQKWRRPVTTPDTHEVKIRRQG